MRKRNRASFITATGTALDDVDYGRDVESFLAQRPGWSLASDVDGEEVQRRRAKVAAATATADAERRAAKAGERDVKVTVPIGAGVMGADFFAPLRLDIPAAPSIPTAPLVSEADDVLGPAPPPVKR